MTNGQIQAAAINAMVTAAVFSVFGQALGIMLAAAGTPVLYRAPKEVDVTKREISALREAYGSSVVDRALATTDYRDLVTVARKIEEIVIADMERDYGEWATEEALMTAPPGDLITVKEIAAQLSKQGVTPVSPPAKKEAAKAEGKRRGKQKAQPVKDTKTGVVYPSKARAGMAVAAEYDLDPTNHFVWYDVIKRSPERFVRA